MTRSCCAATPSRVCLPPEPGPKRSPGESAGRFFDGAHGAAVLVDRKTRRLIAAHAPELAAGSAAPPGSTLKPLVLNALLERGRLRADDTLSLPRRSAARRAILRLLASAARPLP